MCIKHFSCTSPSAYGTDATYPPNFKYTLLLLSLMVVVVVVADEKIEAIIITVELKWQRKQQQQK